MEKPQIIYSDEDRSLKGSELQERGNRITHYTGTSYLRHIKTFKDMLFKEVDNDEKKGKKSPMDRLHILNIIDIKITL